MLYSTYYVQLGSLGPPEDSGRSRKVPECPRKDFPLGLWPSTPRDPKIPYFGHFWLRIKHFSSKMCRIPPIIAPGRRGGLIPTFYDKNGVPEHFFQYFDLFLTQNHWIWVILTQIQWFWVKNKSEYWKKCSGTFGVLGGPTGHNMSKTISIWC